MAEFIDISEQEKNACKTNKEQASRNNQIDVNCVTNKTQESGKNTDVSDEQISLLLQGKLELHEREKELEVLVSKILEENAKVYEKGLEVGEKNENNSSSLIRSRLGGMHARCKNLESIFEGFLNSERNELQNIRMLSGEDEHIVEDRISLAESVFTLFNELVSTIEKLMKLDCDILCREHLHSIKVVMREYNKLEAKCNLFISVFIEK